MCALDIIGRIYTLLGKYSIAVNIYLEALAIYDGLEPPGGKPEADQRIGLKYEAYNELKKVFFPDENISIYGIRKLNFEHEPFKLKVRKEWNY